MSPPRTRAPRISRCHHNLLPSGKAVLAFAVLILPSVGCGAGVPSQDLARAAIKKAVDEGRENRLQLLSFKKTDGRAVEMMGLKSYEVFFEADLEFASKALFSVGSPLMSTGSEITTAEFREASRGFSWNDFISDANGFRRGMKGDQLHLKGSVLFEQRESGWVSSGIQFEVTHDESTRDMEAMRLEEDAKRMAGAWHNGMGCANVNVLSEREILLKLWYCEVGIENAAQLTATRTKDGYSDPDGKVSVVLSGDALIVEQHKEVKDKIGNHALFDRQTRFERYK